jgi:hypothetical protein
VGVSKDKKDKKERMKAQGKIRVKIHLKRKNLVYQYSLD